jgi:hypothetical protein
MEFPFEQKQISENKVQRRFLKTVNKSELVWHMDREDRLVKVIEGKSWKLQIDNTLPVELEVGKEYYIPRMTFHRIIKGDSDLILEILFQ